MFTFEFKSIWLRFCYLKSLKNFASLKLASSLAITFAKPQHLATTVNHASSNTSTTASAMARDCESSFLDMSFSTGADTI